MILVFKLVVKQNIFDSCQIFLLSVYEKMRGRPVLTEQYGGSIHSKPRSGVRLSENMFVLYDFFIGEQ